MMFKQKTAYEMRISDWSSDVCSSDLLVAVGQRRTALQVGDIGQLARTLRKYFAIGADELEVQGDARRVDIAHEADRIGVDTVPRLVVAGARDVGDRDLEPLAVGQPVAGALAQVLGQIVQPGRSEEHTSALQSLMRISYAVFCLKTKTQQY